MSPLKVNSPLLSPAACRQLETWFAEFERSWFEGRLAARAVELPPPGNPLRAPALAGLVQIDLRKHWEHGRRRTIESYLDAYPELGTPETVAADLLLEEYEQRARLGLAEDLAQLASRFPRQFAEVQRLAQQKAAAPPTAPAAAGTVGSPPETQPERLPVSPQSLPEQFGRYHILGRLGEGGMGAVYLARDTQLDRKVALKVPRFTAEDGKDILERFYREARAAATFDHPNLCTVHDVGAIDGVHYLTMAYVEGKTLAALLDGRKALPPREAATVVRKLALALEEAHRKGVIHRDLKPSNVMINQRREPVVMDFGLARRLSLGDARVTRSGAVIGTPAYMPPEQVNGEAATMGPAGDIYSLGVIFYELLTGRLPFVGSTALVLARILTQAPEPPSAHRPGLDPRLEAVCLKAMAKKPANRFASMAEMAAALTDWLRNPGASAAPGARTKPARPQAPPRGAPRPVPPSARDATTARGQLTQAAARLAPTRKPVRDTADSPAPKPPVPGRPPPHDERGPRPVWAWSACGAAALALIAVVVFLLPKPAPEERAAVRPKVVSADVSNGGLKKGKAPKDPALKNPAPKDPALKDPAPKDPAPKDPALKDLAPKDPGLKDPAPKDPAPKDPALKDPALKDPALKDPALKDPAPKDPSERRGDAERIQGRWVVAYETRVGKTVPPPDSRGFIFIGEKMTIFGGSQKIDDKTVFRLDPKKTPKQIDIIGTKAGKLQVLPGIYSLDGDTLRLGFSAPLLKGPPGPRPTSFDARETGVMTLKRAKS